MGLFNFLKPKKDTKNELFEKLSNQIFPKGDKDINAGTDELLFILDNTVDRDTAKSIFVKAMVISAITEKFDEERLKAHLRGYCLEYFNPDQVKTYHIYLVALTTARVLHRKTPSEVKRDNHKYYW